MHIGWWISAILEKGFKRRQRIISVLWKDDLWRKPEVKNLVILMRENVNIFRNVNLNTLKSILCCTKQNPMKVWEIDLVLIWQVVHQMFFYLFPFSKKCGQKCQVTFLLLFYRLKNWHVCKYVPWKKHNHRNAHGFVTSLKLVSCILDKRDRVCTQETTLLMTEWRTLSYGIHTVQ